MSELQGAPVVILGGGVTGLSTAWWLARAGIDALVVERGIVGWEASGRNGGGCTHYASPLFREEQRLWPQMDEMLGYPTEHRPYRIGVAMEERQLLRFRRMAEIAAQDGFPRHRTRSQAIARGGPLGQRRRVGRHVLPFRRPCEPATHRASLRLGVPGFGRTHSCNIPKCKDLHRPPGG